MTGSMIFLQLLGLLVFGALAVFMVMRQRKQANALATVQPGLEAVRTGFAQSRVDGESEPVCVVAYHKTMMGMTQVTIGVTNHRVLVVKGAGPLHAFPYDYEGEHLPNEQKTAQGRGFFMWKHNSEEDYYCPVVKNHPPFSGEQWRMYPTIIGYPEQTASLEEFAHLFYFQWFYD